MNHKKIVFFGTPEFAVWTLESLARHGIHPDLIVTAVDKPAGRKLVLTLPPAKVWAEKNNVRVIQPSEVKSDSFRKEIEAILGGRPDLYIVSAYGKILPKALIEQPAHGTINVHPSLLPLLRGASPLESAILSDMRDTGVTVMRIDEDLDHGPILAEESVLLPTWPIDTDSLGKILASEGGKLIARILESLFDGSLHEAPQDHSRATFTKKIKKEDGLMDLTEDGYENFLKWNAYRGWPGSYFFVEKDGKKIRISIRDAVYEDGQFVVKKVVPEGKKEMSFKEFESWVQSSLLS
jgi:methionyl-tRNA formyltransferase